MEVHAYTWIITVAVMVAILAIDIFIIGRRPHEPSMKESGTFIGVFVGLAVVFGLGVWATSGAQYAGEFFAGWLTEYSLSIDNLFIFIIIMGKLAVPRKYQQFALMVGIVLALIFRGVFIALGAVAIDRFAAVFFLFGLFLLYTAVKLVIDYRKHSDETEDAGDNWVMRRVKRAFPSTEEYHGTRLTVKVHGRRLLTPMLFVIIALGTTDLMFALDSIPAIFGLTKEPYLVFTANVFALMGLRQLYFLIGNLLKRLVYLSLGLSVILAFIGVKLILHALHETPVLTWFGGDPHLVPEIPIWMSLTVLVVTLGITTIASLVKSRYDDDTRRADTRAAEQTDDTAETIDEQEGSARETTGSTDASGPAATDEQTVRLERGAPAAPTERDHVTSVEGGTGRSTRRSEEIGPPRA